MVKHAMTMQPYLTTKCNVGAQVFAQNYVAAVFGNDQKISNVVSWRHLAAVMRNNISINAILSTIVMVFI